MPFKKEQSSQDSTKPKAMTTADQINKPVTVVSTQSSATHQEEINNLPDVGAQEATFEEAGHPINFDLAAEEPLVTSAQVARGTDMAEYPETFAPNQTINKMRTEDLNDFMRASVIARPVRLPARLNARSKDPRFRLRWVECKAEDGRRWSDCEAMGFRNAKREEVVGLDKTIKVGADGVIKADDLILMIIPCEIIDGYLKHNALSALRMVSQKGSAKMAKAEGDNELRKGIASEGYNPNSRSMRDAFGRPKIDIYVPGA